MIYKYIRFSTQKQEELSQDNIISEYLFRKGMVADETYKDEGVSGGKNYKDRNLGKLCAKLKAGDTVVVSEVSRITRNGIAELCDIVERYFKPNNLRLIICNYGLDIDCSNMNPLVEMQLYMLVVFAKIEKDSIRERTRASLSRIKDEIEQFGFHISKKGNKITRLGCGSMSEECRNAAAERSRQKALNNPNNVAFWKYLQLFEKRNGKFSEAKRGVADKWEQLARELNELNYVTSTGLPFTSMRCRNMYRVIKTTMGENI